MKASGFPKFTTFGQPISQLFKIREGYRVAEMDTAIASSDGGAAHSAEAVRFRIKALIDEETAETVLSDDRIVEILRNSDRVRASTLQQWQQLGRRSLFDVMAAEGDYYGMRVAHVNAMFDAQQVVALIWSMGRGVVTPLR